MASLVFAKTRNTTEQLRLGHHGLLSRVPHRYLVPMNTLELAYDAYKEHIIEEDCAPWPRKQHI